MARLQPVAAEAVTEAQREIHDRIVNGPRGQISPPFRVMLNSPGLASVLEQVGVYLRYQTEIPGWLREFVILIVCRHWKCGYEWSSHVHFARVEGLDEALIADIAAGTDFAIRAAEPLVQLAYRYTRQLLDDAVIDDALYDALLAALGERGMADVTGLAGYFAALAMTINAHAVPPKPGTVLPW